MITDQSVRQRARITGVGDYRPARLVTNDELPAALEPDDEWIVTRTGIRARRIADATETVVTMSAQAAEKAFAAAGVDPTDVGLVVLATCSLPAPVPGGAARVATLVGAVSAGAFDVNAACAGFCYALGMAADAVRSGRTRHVVVIGAEKLSDWTDWTDRRSAILFGDGAGAVVVSAASADGIGPLVCGSDGTLAHLIGITAAGKLGLDGPAVYRWATSALTEVAQHTCAAAGVEPAQLAALVPHQANLRIVNAIARGLGADRVVVADDITESGNTSAASVPLALSRLVQTGAVVSGDLALLLGFGAGLTWAGQVIEVP